MQQDNDDNEERHSSRTIQFNVWGLAGFSAVLILATGLLTWFLLTYTGVGRFPVLDSRGRVKPPGDLPAWGELVTYDVDLEQPEEYVAFEIETNRPSQWVFSGMDKGKVRELLLECGFTAALADRALSAQFVKSTPAGTTVFPEDRVVLALTPEMRGKLYGVLARDTANHYMQYPFCYPRDAFVRWFGNGSKDDPLLALVRKLLYPRGDGMCFSDYELVLRQAGSETERLNLVKSLSRQSAVLARLRIRPDSDIDKLMGYWGKGLQVKDARPLVESLARLEDGGTVSLLYFLPNFVRERLYTFPLPSKAGDPIMDCHWSTMNFFNDPPSNLFTNTSYTSAFIETNYYQVAKPTAYGDIVFILDAKGNAIHSATYLADEIVFTKNGNNFSQPWMLMRLADLLGRYTADAPPKILTYRKRHT